MISSGEAGGLLFDLRLAEGVSDGATLAVLLHGRGSHKGDLQALGPVLPPDWALVTPQAPFAGAEWGYGEGWAWYEFIDEDRLVPETLERSLELLDTFLAALPDAVGLTPGRLVMGGFSQGGTTSLAYAITRPGALSAAFNFSGYLAASVELPERLGDGSTPIFWGHGVRDANIPLHIADRGRQRLHEAGARLVIRDYPIGHWMLPDEIHEAVSMVEGAV